MFTKEEILHIVHEEVEALPFEFELKEENGFFILQAKLWRKDTFTGEMGWGYGGEKLIRPTITRRNLVMSCYALVESFAVHEVRESFKWKGQRIVGPHIELDAMWEAAGRIDGMSDPGYL